jgi:hypothetical protein
VTVTQKDVETQLTPGNGNPTMPGPAPVLVWNDPTPLTSHCPDAVHAANPRLLVSLVASFHVRRPPAGSVETRGAPATMAATQRAVVGHEMPLTAYWLLCCAKDGCFVGPPDQDPGTRGSVEDSMKPPTVTPLLPPATQSREDGHEMALSPGALRWMCIHADEPPAGDLDTSTPAPVAMAQNETVGHETCPKKYPDDGTTSRVQCAVVGSVVAYTPSAEDNTHSVGPGHATKDHEVLEFAVGEKVVVVPTTLPWGVNGPVLTATAGTSSPGLGGEMSPAKTHRFSLGHDTSVGLSPRSFSMVDQVTVGVPGALPGFVSQLGCCDPPAGKSSAPVFANESVKSDCSHDADGSSVVKRRVCLL